MTTKFWKMGQAGITMMQFSFPFSLYLKFVCTTHNSNTQGERRPEKVDLSQESQENVGSDSNIKYIKNKKNKNINK